MQLLIADFNGADTLCQGRHHKRWLEVEGVLAGMPLHLKASDQAGKKGSPIFDPVGTNACVKTGLRRLGWAAKIPIPSDWAFLGTDVDFSRDGVLAEAQFSNYPFLLNNILRAELFVQSAIALPEKPTELLVVVTKAHMFPASNSTLYFEQARNQLAALAKHKVFDAPVRLVGLAERLGAVRCVYTEYQNPRHSRKVVRQRRRKCEILGGANTDNRARIKLP